MKSFAKFTQIPHFHEEPGSAERAWFRFVKRRGAGVGFVSSNAAVGPGSGGGLGSFRRSIGREIGFVSSGCETPDRAVWSRLEPTLEYFQNAAQYLKP